MILNFKSVSMLFILRARIHAYTAKSSLLYSKWKVSKVNVLSKMTVNLEKQKSGKKRLGALFLTIRLRLRHKYTTWQSYAVLEMQNVSN